jgi:hypothetical protein
VVSADDLAPAPGNPPIRLGVDGDLTRHDRVVDLLGPLLPPLDPPQWVHRAHGRRVASAYASEAARLFELTDDLRTCDVAVLAVGWEQVLLEPELGPAARAFCEAAGRHGKAVLAFVDGDDHVPSPGDNAVVLRTSLDRVRCEARDVALPAWISDPGLQRPRPYRPRAAVGFCGQAYPLDLPARRVDKRAKFYGRVALTHLGVVERLGKHPAFTPRLRAVRALARAREVDADVTLRSSMTRLDLDTELEHRLYQEFVSSLAGSDYVLSVRGEGNYSYRLYEALAAGRIPVYVDTDAVLPLESRVPWGELCVVVPRRDIRTIGAVVAEAHEAMGPEGFARRQAQARDVWERQLSMQGFFRTLHSHLTSRRDTGEGVTPDDLAAALR